jgi:hypothetical protein
LFAWTRRGLAVAAFALLVAPAPAAAYDASTTLAGLTEQAALSSRLHRRLMERMSCSLGLFEPLRLDLSSLRPELARSLHVRLLALDDGQGYAPELLARQPGQTHPARRQHALGWLSAGTVIESVPALRQRHHFFDPRSGRGLFRPAEMTATAASWQSVRDGMSSTRQLLAGAACDGTGTAAPDWVESAANELSVSAFLSAYENAVLQKTPAARESALAQALLIAGSIVGVLEQMGDPAHVRNDLSAVIDGAYQRSVSERYGRAGVPAPGSVTPEALSPKHLRELFTTDTGLGLADRTARRFYSPGTLPGTEYGDRPALVAGGPEAGKPRSPSQPFTDEHGQPVAEILVPPGWPPGAAGYLSTPQLKHLAVWTRHSAAELDPHTEEPLQNLRFSLDEACMGDYAALLLPEIGRYAQVALDYLFRGELRLSLGGDGQSLIVRVSELALGTGTLTLLFEQPEGTRRVVSTQQTLPTRPGTTLATLPLSERDTRDIRRLVVLFRGRDRYSEPVVISAQLVLPMHERGSESQPDAKPDAKPDSDDAKPSDGTAH